MQSASEARNAARTEKLEAILSVAREDVDKLEERLHWLSLAAFIMIMVVLSLVITVVTLQSKSERNSKHILDLEEDDVPPTPPSNVSKPKSSSKKKSRGKSRGRSK